MHTASIVNFLFSDTVEERPTECSDTNCAKKIAYISTLAWWKIWNRSILWLLRNRINVPFNGKRAHWLDHPKPSVRVASVRMLLTSYKWNSLRLEPKYIQLRSTECITEGCLPAQPYVDVIKLWFISNIDSKAKRPLTNQNKGWYTLWHR